MKTIFAMMLVLVSVSGVMADEAVLDSTNLEVLRAKAGTEVVVEGLVTDIGTTKDGGITFVNIGLPKKEGFVAVAFRDHYEAFVDGFDKYRGKKVRVSGLLKLYRGETPQIEIKSPEKITIVEE